MKKKALVAWSFYDFANSAFAAVMQTFLLPAYFVKQVYQDDVGGAAVWGVALGISGFMIALTGPLVGTLADQWGGKKRGMAFFALILMLATSLQFFTMPSPAYVPYTLLLFGVSVLAAESAFVLYNSMLADIAAPKEIGKWSGYGWGLGYFGGMCALIACSFFTGPEGGWISNKDGLDIRFCFLFVALWYALFATPLFLWVPSKERGGVETLSVKKAFGKLYQFFFVEKNRDLLYFFVARMFYIDGLITLFAFGGIYAAAEHHFSERDILFYGIGLNIAAGIGSILLGRLDDKIGPYQLISFSLLAMIASGIGILLATSSLFFWGMSLILGFFLGPVQSASRSFLAKIAPPERRGELFGFFSLAGKATSFMGPFIVSFSIATTGSLKGGMAAILGFFALGFFLLHKIDLKSIALEEKSNITS